MTQTSTQQPPRSGNALDDVFARLRAGDLRRDPGNRWFGGVCAGLAARFGVDPLLIRAAAIALTIAGGLAIPLYLVLWLVLPDREGTLLAERALRHGDVWPVVLGIAAGLTVLGGLVSVGTGGDGWGGGSLWIVLPVALVVWFLATRSRAPHDTAWSGALQPAGATPPPPPPPGGDPMSGPTSSYAPPAGAGQAHAAPPPAGPGPYGGPPPTGPHGAGPVPPAPPRPIAPPPPPAPRRRRPSGYVGLVSLGLAALLFGLGILLEGPLGMTDDPPVLGFAMALAGVAAVVLGLGVSGRASGFSGFLVVVLGFVTVLAGAANHVVAGDGFGDRTWTPAATSLPASYSLGAGDAVLDLSALGTLPTAPSGASPAAITTEMGAGQLTIEVPEGLDVRVEASAGVGEIRHERSLPDGTDDTVRRGGTDPSYVVTIGDDTPDLVVRSEIGFGDIIIEEN